MSTAGLLLAAGSGRRMGGPKALLELAGETLVARGIRLLRDGGCAPVVVVVGAHADEVRACCAGTLVVEATDWSTGMGASLRAGLDSLSAHDDVAGCVVALVDQPLIGVEAVRRLLACPGPVAVASYDGRGRNPVRLARSVWSDVATSAVGDIGARDFLRAHPEIVTAVDCTGTGDPRDLDTPEDLRRLRAGVLDAAHQPAHDPADDPADDKVAT